MRRCQLEKHVSVFTTCQGISDSINVWEMGHQKRDGSSDGDVGFEIAKGCVGESGCARRGGSFEMWKCGEVKVGALRTFRGEAGLRTVLGGMSLEGSFNIHVLGNITSL